LRLLALVSSPRRLSSYSALEPCSIHFETIVHDDTSPKVQKKIAWRKLAGGFLTSQMAQSRRTVPHNKS